MSKLPANRRCRRPFDLAAHLREYLPEPAGAAEVALQQRALACLMDEHRFRLTNRRMLEGMRAGTCPSRHGHLQLGALRAGARQVRDSPDLMGQQGLGPARSTANGRWQ
ncbi:hypothetical protein SSTU70S_00694 [Stutzerimonas stutzeri]